MCLGFEIVITPGQLHNHTLQTDEVLPRLQPPDGAWHCIWSPCPKVFSSMCWTCVLQLKQQQSPGVGFNFPLVLLLSNKEHLRLFPKCFTLVLNHLLLCKMFQLSCWENPLTHKQWVGTVTGRLMSSPSVYPHILTHSVKAEEMKVLTSQNLQWRYLIHLDPLLTLIQEPLNTINRLRICLWAWTRLSLPLSHEICGLIYKCAFAASAALLQTLAARKNNFLSAGTIHLWPSWGMELRVLARSVLIAHWLTLAHIHVSQTKELHIHFWDLPPRLLAN